MGKPPWEDFRHTIAYGGLPVREPMIHLTREVRFSVDRDWAGHLASTRAVTNSWAGWPSAVGLVPYLCLRATVRGIPDPQTGYVCNIKQLDDLLRRFAIPHAAELLREHGWHLPAEHLLGDVWHRLAEHFPGQPVLMRLELCATPCLRYAVERKDATMVLLTQQFEFSAAHRLHCPQLSNEENRRVFGKCNNPHGHGHNYLLEVTVSGHPDAGTGALLPLPRFEQIVKERVVDHFDHKHLNLDTLEFRETNPSVENIARVIFQILDGHVLPARLHHVRVWETPKTWAEYGAD